MPPVQFTGWQWVALLLTAPVLGWGALPLYRSALAGVRRGTASPDLLVSLTVLTAVAASLRGLLTGAVGAPGYTHTVTLTAIWGGPSGALYLEVVAILTTVALAVRLLAAESRIPPHPDTDTWVAPAALHLAVGAGAFWSGSGAGPTGGVELGLAVLVTACPLARALAHPAAVLATTDALRRRGMTVHGADTTAILSRITTVLIAGSGTLTGHHSRAGTGTAPGGPAAVARLRGLGLDPVLLTGDPSDVARAQGDLVGVDSVVAGLPPRARAAAVHRMQAAGAVVAVISTNPADTPALAAADLGIALAADARHVDAPGVVVRNGDPTAAVEALRLARCLPIVVRAARRWAAGVVCLAVPLAASGLLHPAVALGAPLLGAAGVTAISQRLRGPSPEWSPARPQPHQEERS